MTTIQDAIDKNDALANEQTPVLQDMTADQIMKMCEEEVAKGQRGAGLKALCDYLGIDHNELAEASDKRSVEFVARATAGAGLPPGLARLIAAIVTTSYTDAFLAGIRWEKER